jgi:phosphonate transport system ATP-binding protein
VKQQMGACVTFDNLSTVFPDGPQALSSISLRVEAGTFCVLLGPSGSGKSTLLRCINGLETPSGGRIHINDVEVRPHTLKDLRRRIGTIHQHFGLVSRDTVANNVLAGVLPEISTWRALVGWFPAKFQDRVASLLQSAGLEPSQLNRRASDLSGGQQQRVGIARAFMLSPPLILADEPIASLDPKLSHEILSLIAQQAASVGATVLCSLHQIDLAKAFADRIVALNHGRVVFDGAPKDLTEAKVTQIYGATLLESERALAS